jgi:cell division protein FtsB
LSRAANTYWVDERIQTQRVTHRREPRFLPVREVSVELFGSRAEVRRRGGVIPSWVIFGMILMAASSLLVTIVIRTHAQVRSASERHLKLQDQVDTLRKTNSDLANELERLRTDPRAIELAARERLNMVRANEVIVPLE